jgi:hypothetical protein
MSPRGDKLGTDGNGGSGDLRSRGTVNKGGRPHRDNGRPKRSFRSVPRAARKGTLQWDPQDLETTLLGNSVLTSISSSSLCYVDLGVI